MAKFVDALDILEIANYNNRKIVLSTKDGKPLRITTPRMYMPFGVSGFTPEVGQTKYNIDFSMKGHDEEGNYVKKFHDTLRSIENKIIESVAEQSETIFGKTMTKDELVPMFNSNIKESPDREPKFRVKVDTTIDGDIKASVCDPEKNVLSDSAENGLYARNTGLAIVELNSVYFLNRKFGITWKLYNLMVFEPQRLKGFQFVV
jgi:hypothetical protein